MAQDIIRIRNLVKEIDLNGIIFPVDKQEYLADARYIGIDDLKDWILSGYTASVTGGTSGTSGVDGIDGIDGETPCETLYSNVIRIIIDENVCELDGYIDCTCMIEGVADCNSALPIT